MGWPLNRDNSTLNSTSTSCPTPKVNGPRLPNDSRTGSIRPLVIQESLSSAWRHSSPSPVCRACDLCTHTSLQARLPQRTTRHLTTSDCRTSRTHPPRGREPRENTGRPSRGPGSFRSDPCYPRSGPGGMWSAAGTQCASDPEGEFDVNVELDERGEPLQRGVPARDPKASGNFLQLFHHIWASHLTATSTPPSQRRIAQVELRLAGWHTSRGRMNEFTPMRADSSLPAFCPSN